MEIGGYSAQMAREGQYNGYGVIKIHHPPQATIVPIMLEIVSIIVSAKPGGWIAFSG